MHAQASVTAADDTTLVSVHASPRRMMRPRTQEQRGQSHNGRHDGRTVTRREANERSSRSRRSAYVSGRSGTVRSNISNPFSVITPGISPPGICQASRTSRSDVKRESSPRMAPCATGKEQKKGPPRRAARRNSMRRLVSSSEPFSLASSLRPCRIRGSGTRPGPPGSRPCPCGESPLRS